MSATNSYPTREQVEATIEDAKRISRWKGLAVSVVFVKSVYDGSTECMVCRQEYTETERFAELDGKVIANINEPK